MATSVHIWRYKIPEPLKLISSRPLAGPRARANLVLVFFLPLVCLFCLGSEKVAQISGHWLGRARAAELRGRGLEEDGGDGWIGRRNGRRSAAPLADILHLVRVLMEMVGSSLQWAINRQSASTLAGPGDDEDDTTNEEDGPKRLAGRPREFLQLFSPSASIQFI